MPRVSPQAPLPPPDPLEVPDPPQLSDPPQVSEPLAPSTRPTEPGLRVALLGAALVVTAVAFDLTFAGRLTMFFDLAFVVACLGLALVVRSDDVFTVGVLPPLLMLAGCVLLAAVDPAALGAPGDGVVQATVTGLAHHSAALVNGFALCLATLGVRRRQAQSSKREVSPAP